MGSLDWRDILHGEGEVDASVRSSVRGKAMVMAVEGGERLDVGGEGHIAEPPQGTRFVFWPEWLL